MQILNSGSFVNLDNKEKIEHLIFTAKEMGRAANETDGFVNEPENNKRLALEIWQGAEYMTRDHEEAQIKNIFVSNFLDCLREISGRAKTTETVAENAVGDVEAFDASSKIEPPKDEFLGLVSAEEIEEESVNNSADLIVRQEGQPVEIAVSENAASTADIEVENGKSEITEPAQESQTTAEEIEIAEPESKSVETKESTENNQSGEKQTEDNSPPVKVPGAIVLPEKEPYRWEKCTITATIQLLPTADDDSDNSSGTTKRKAVLSVRTHDFAPQFSVVELRGEGESILSELLPALEQSFEKYKMDLPLKVMDKMKKEKSVAKKQSSKTTVTAKTSAANNSSADSQPKPGKNPIETVITKTENAKPATAAVAPQQVVVPAGSSQQGSLFGF